MPRRGRSPDPCHPRPPLPPAPARSPHRVCAPRHPPARQARRPQTLRLAVLPPCWACWAVPCHCRSQAPFLCRPPWKLQRQLQSLLGAGAAAPPWTRGWQPCPERPQVRCQGPVSRPCSVGCCHRSWQSPRGAGAAAPPWTRGGQPCPERPQVRCQGPVSRPCSVGCCHRSCAVQARWWPKRLAWTAAPWSLRNGVTRRNAGPAWAVLLHALELPRLPPLHWRWQRKGRAGVRVQLLPMRLQRQARPRPMALCLRRHRQKPPP